MSVLWPWSAQQRQVGNKALEKFKVVRGQRTGKITYVAIECVKK